MLVQDFIAKVLKYNQKLLRQNRRHEHALQQEEDRQVAQAMLGGDPASAAEPGAIQKIESFMGAVDDVKKEPDHEFVSQLITEHYSQRLFQTVSDFINNKSLEEDAVDEDGYASEYGDEDADGVYQDQLEEYWEEDQTGAGPKTGAKGRGRQGDHKNAHVEARKRREREKLLREKRRWEFPQKIGSHYSYVSPALEFTKFICNHVFGLDEAFHSEAAKVKSNLFRMLHCKEFSPEAQDGVEPSLVLVVPDVICEHCCHCFDLDLCRDLSLNAMEGESNPANAAESANWLCANPECEQALNKLDLERRLLDLVNRRLISYQLQDLECKQCKMVKNSVVSRYCECTGAFQ